MPLILYLLSAIVSHVVMGNLEQHDIITGV